MGFLNCFLLAFFVYVDVFVPMHLCTHACMNVNKNVMWRHLSFTFLLFLKGGDLELKNSLTVLAHDQTTQHLHKMGAEYFLFCFEFFSQSFCDLSLQCQFHCLMCSCFWNIWHQHHVAKNPVWVQKVVLSYLWGACCKTCNQISLENLYSLSTINNFRYKVDHIYYGFRIIKLLEMFSFPNRESENDKNILSSPITEWSNATRDAVYLLDARNYILLDFNHILSDQFSSCMCTLLSTLVCVHVNTDFLRMWMPWTFPLGWGKWMHYVHHDQSNSTIMTIKQHPTFFSHFNF